MVTITGMKQYDTERLSELYSDTESSISGFIRSLIIWCISLCIGFYILPHASYLKRDIRFAEIPLSIPLSPPMLLIILKVATYWTIFQIVTRINYALAIRRALHIRKADPIPSKWPLGALGTMRLVLLACFFTPTLVSLWVRSLVPVPILYTALTGTALVEAILVNVFFGVTVKNLAGQPESRYSFRHYWGLKKVLNRILVIWILFVFLVDSKPTWYLSFANISNTKCSQYNFSEARCERMEAQDNHFHGCNLDGAILWRSKLDGTNFSGASMEGANLSKVIAHRSVFIGTNLNSANCKYSVFRKSQFVGACLARADLRFSKLAESMLVGCNLDYADLSNSDLKNSDCRKSTFVGACLTGADLTGADLTGCDFSGAEGLSSVQIHDATGDKTTTLPCGVKPPPHWT